MKLSLVVAALVSTMVVQAASAETHIFLIDSFGGYGIDRCLASGEACGEAAATTLCRNREYAKAVDYGRIDPSEITGVVSMGMKTMTCKGSSCPEVIAITCSR